MNYKLSFNHLFLMISLFVFGCSGAAKEEKKKKGPADSISLHVGDEKYFTVDTTESVVIWKGSSLEGKHNG